MEANPDERLWYQKIFAIGDHPFLNVGFLAWGLFVAIVWATVRDDVYLIAKAGEIVALALGRLLIQHQLRYFFGGLLATSLALPIALYTTTPIFWHEFLPIRSQEFLQTILLGGLCGLPLFFIGFWWLRKRASSSVPSKPDPQWIKGLNQLFKWTLAGMFFSFHLASPPLIIAGILIFLAGMIALATVRLSLTTYHVGNLLLMVGIGTIVIAFLLIPLGIAHVNGGEAAMAAIPGFGLAVLGLILRAGRS